MKVSDLHGILKGTDPRENRVTDQSSVRRAPDNAQSAHGDSLDISLSVNLSEVSKEVADAMPEAESALTPQRVTEIRSRMDSGFYLQTPALRAVADGILDFYGR